MNTLTVANLKKLMLSLGENQVVTASYLLKRGYSYDNLKGYVRSGYLDSLGRGAYCRAGSTPSVEAAIAAMAEQQGVPLHLGGRSALAKRGFVHFVPFKEFPATVFLAQGVRLPAWFTHRYSGRFLMRKTNFIEGNCGVESEAGCPISSPERAILEFLLDVPARQLLNEAYQLLEMMMTLRPGLVRDLLSTCTSIKVKRLFFLLADDINPPWWSRVRKDGIDLGSGCRVVDRDGSFQAKYNLVVKPWREI